MRPAKPNTLHKKMEHRTSCRKTLPKRASLERTHEVYHAPEPRCIATYLKQVFVAMPVARSCFDPITLQTWGNHP